jgi:biopolymer transport protein ExbD
MAKKRKEQENLEFNMTPMIDVTFQLIIFFIIAGTIVSDELAALKVPRPTETEAREEFNTTTGIIVNIVSEMGDEEGEGPEASRAKYWFVHRKEIDVGDIDELKRVLEETVKKLSPKEKAKFTVEIRGDYRVQYGDIETVLLACAEAGIPKMNITAIADTKRND